MEIGARVEWLIRNQFQIDPIGFCDSRPHTENAHAMNQTGKKNKSLFLSLCAKTEAPTVLESKNQAHETATFHELTY